MRRGKWANPVGLSRTFQRDSAVQKVRGRDLALHAYAYLSAPAVPAGRPRFTLVAAAGPHLPRVTWREIIQLRLAAPEIQEGFVRDWLPVVEQEARRYTRQGGPADELFAEGSLALWEAVQQYNPQQHRTAPAQYIQNHVHRRVRRAYREAMGYGRPETAPAEALALVGRPDQRLAAVESAVDLAGSVAELKPGEQAEFATFARMALSGMGPDEAARAMSAGGSRSFAATKKRLERIRRKVADLLSRP